jgi:hypothetical protein
MRTMHAKYFHDRCLSSGKLHLSPVWFGDDLSNWWLMFSSLQQSPLSSSDSSLMFCATCCPSLVGARVSMKESNRASLTGTGTGPSAAAALLAHVSTACRFSRGKLVHKLWWLYHTTTTTTSLVHLLTNADTAAGLARSTLQPQPFGSGVASVPHSRRCYSFSDF